MESNFLEFKVLSCKDLRGFNFFQKLLVYARVSIVSDDPSKKVDNNQSQRTPTDKEGDGNPEWNHEIRFDLDQISLENSHHLYIQFDLFHEGVMFGDKPIGEVRVPIGDLVGDLSGVRRFVSYQVQLSDGKSNGVLNFSYKVNGKGKEIKANSLSGEITGFPVVNHDQLPDNLYPTSEISIHSSSVRDFPVPESTNSYQSTQEVNSSSPQYPPPPAPHQSGYYPPPPPPPPPPPSDVYFLWLHRPLRPPMMHGAFHHHRPPPPPHHHHGWRPEYYGYGGPYGYGGGEEQLRNGYGR